MWFMQTLPLGALRFYRPYTKFMMAAKTIGVGFFFVRQAAHDADTRSGDTDAERLEGQTHTYICSLTLPHMCRGDLAASLAVQNDGSLGKAFQPKGCRVEAQVAPATESLWTQCQQTAPK